jgi:hypothetical protein
LVFGKRAALTSGFFVAKNTSLHYFVPMAKNRTATVIFKGDDQISPAIKGATNSVAGTWLKSFNAVDEAAKKGQAF